MNNKSRHITAKRGRMKRETKRNTKKGRLRDGIQFERQFTFLQVECQDAEWLLEVLDWTGLDWTQLDCDQELNHQ